MDALYREAVDLADQARAWFDGPGVAWRAGLPVDAQAVVATESLATTARLMAVMAWLLDPAHLGSPAAASRGAVMADDGGALRIDSPLAGTPGGTIVDAARRLVAKVVALAPKVEPLDFAAAPVADGGLWHA